MKNLLVAGAIGTWLLGSACGRLGTGDNTIEGGDGDASVGSNKGDGDSGDGDVGDGDSGDGDVGDGDVGDGDAGDGDVGDGDLGGMPGDGDLGDGDGLGGLGGSLVGDGDGDIVFPDPRVPSCTITSPEDNVLIAFHGERLKFSNEEPAVATFSGITFQAVATDLDDGPLKGASIAWYLEGAGALGGDEYLGQGNEIIVEELPPGENKIICKAYDTDQNVGYGSVHVTSVSPVVYINHPGELDGPRPAGEPVEFFAQGFDYEDRELNPETFVWGSSIDGKLGEGNASHLLSSGKHEVRVEVSDSDQNTATATVPVWIGEVQIESTPTE